MLNINPEHLLQFGIKAVQDLACSAHYLCVSIKASDFQCISPHDNVQGGVAFSFQPGLAKNGASFARVLILENWMPRLSGTRMNTASL